ncbi:hypothetical protein KY290_032129 [Solanum tuberosum]|uniref:Uncharacterized protein n=1 Tax=Solanum tuberosum TaxID=4113 RepID=A0ABQ7UCU3_SOLTU|nr:hypothetical protein KY284_000171 [Solanum tuberosum]KAH0744136.1 hypothetical protein KY290_032129 [Solanum tuberosum]KAH0764285.1 hypothetical protein KY285_000156 [Solanum tuberosum]
MSEDTSRRKSRSLIGFIGKQKRHVYHEENVSQEIKAICYEDISYWTTTLYSLSSHYCDMFHV